MPYKPTITTTYDPPSSASRGPRPAVPLLALAPPALALGEEILGQGDEETNVRDFWNVISKASEIVKDGERLENLAWRQWCQHRRDSSSSGSSNQCRRVSFSSTSSSISPTTPHLESERPPSPCASISSRHSDRRTFGSALKLLMEEDQFIDWVSDAQKNLPLPTISVPDTPTAQLEIRLVEPTPVPSRVGSLGGSMGASGLLGVNAHRRFEEPEEQEVVEEEEEEDDQDIEEEEEDVMGAALNKRSIRKDIASKGRSPKKRGRFYVHSSPSKGSGSDTAISPILNADQTALPDPPLSPSPALSPGPVPPKHTRTSSDSSASVGVAIVAPTKKKSPGVKRHVSLSTMRGRFGVEKRKAAELLAEKMAAEAEAEAAAAAQEDSGWEDEVEDDGEEEDEGDYEDIDEEDEAVTGEAKVEDEETEVDEAENQDGDWSDEKSDNEQAPQQQPVVPPPRPTSPAKRSPKPPALAAPPSRPDYMRRTSSNRSAKSNTNSDSTSHLDLAALLTRTTSRKSRAEGPPPPPAPTPLRKMSKKQRMAAQEERKKIEAELEAQKKREMFAKQQIFGGRSVPGEGLLSGIFKKGGSMVDLTTAAVPQLMSPPLRPSPTHGHLPSLSRSPMGQALLRSKSAVAVPVQTGVSVTRVSPQRSKLNEEIASGGSGESNHNGIDRARRSSDRSDKSGSNEMRPPKGIVLESDDSSSGEDDYLATSSTRRKLAELAAKRAQRGKSTSAEDTVNAVAGPSMPPPATQQPIQNGPSAVRFDMPGVLQPMMTPSTRRRTIISREMSESLRRNLILEREKSSGGGPRRTSVGPATHSRPPPISHVSHLPARNSSANLAQYQMGAPLARHRSETALHREQREAEELHHRQQHSPPRSGSHTHHSSTLVHPQPHRSVTTGSVITIGTRLRPLVHPPPGLPEQGRASTARPQAPSTNPPPNQPDPIIRRKAQPNVLGGFLRPLTRVGVNDTLSINRTQSSANLTTARNEASEEVSPTMIEAPAMTRRLTTDGSASPDWKSEIDRRRELARRTSGIDSSYRMHGW